MEKFVLSILVANQFGVLTRVSGLFARRCFNIDSLTVGETESPEFSRITVAMTGDAGDKDQLLKQVMKLHDVREAQFMEDSQAVFRELLLIKVRTSPETRQDIMDAVSVFRCKIIDYSSDSQCIEITGETQKIDAFISLMKPFGIIEMCRTGVTALERGSNALSK